MRHLPGACIGCLVVAVAARRIVVAVGAGSEGGDQEDCKSRKNELDTFHCGRVFVKINDATKNAACGGVHQNKVTETVSKHAEQANSRYIQAHSCGLTCVKSAQTNPYKICEKTRRDSATM
jgi:hypothetical protein